MSTENQPLADRCAGFAQAARDAVNWVEDEENAETVNRQRAETVRLLRKHARRADKLSRAAAGNMAISVFGPSQAGKSYLVSVLARPKGGTLVADYAGDGGQLDYIKHINPEGEGESTGLVTRFTMQRVQTPDGFPIPLRLLSESDILRTIVNTFYMDGDLSDPPPEPEDIERHIAAFKGKTAAAPHPGLDDDGVWEVAEYIEQNFARRATYAGKLGGGSFFEDAASIAPRLSLADRTQFLSILWGGHKALSDLYFQMAEALGKLSHETEIFAPLGALTPLHSSIIDVAALKGLFSGSDSLEVRTASGKQVALPRSLLCALAAELVLPMRDLPHDMFAQTDLLDFPGTRNRFEVALSKSLEKPEETIPEMLLRGKVAYLFDRYVDHQEITSMLLCIPPSNMEAKDLPGLVDRWIAMTHGDTPQKRKDADCILFMILTKFDMHLEDKATESDDSFRFDKRIKMSLLEKFGRQNDSWNTEWTPNEKFRNCFWVRNPNFPNDGLFNYQDMGEWKSETLREDKVDLIARLRTGCLEAENVKNHFADPGRAFDAAMEKDDGGISYLIEHLEPVCRPSSKANQIGAQISEIEHSAHTALSGFYVSNDLDQRKAEKEAEADLVMDSLEVALERRRFGAVSAALMVDEDAVLDRLSLVPANVHISAARAPAAEATGSVGSIRPKRNRPRPGRTNGDDQAPAPEPAAKSEDEVRIMTREAFQADVAMKVWVEALHRFKNDPDASRRLGFDAEAATSLVTELLAATRRDGLQRRMEEALSKIDFGLTADRQARPASVILSEMINRYVATLGYFDKPENQRPKVEIDGKPVPVFAEKPGDRSVNELPQVPHSIVDRHCKDWLHALDAMYQDNARNIDGSDINEEQNSRIGEILRRIQHEEAAE